MEKGKIKNCKTLPGADANTDHNLLVANLKTKLKHIIRQRGNDNWDFRALKNDSAIMYGKKVNEVPAKTDKRLHINEEWKLGKNAIWKG
ncbi:hypothetical protein J437_LFUL016485 [Ladona fulva]|uniref:Uncharacterized protein n=1 Tax=Ladona fulva TaxID=123851 RepID=A0A8K0KKG8_LADFU|nr:hypothetical protein J437_LFUL016485 [Ladona fulva]